MSLFLRVPALLMALMIVWLVTRRDGQIGALFELLRWPQDVLVLSGSIGLASLALAMLSTRPTKKWQWPDLALFVVPVLAISWLFAGSYGAKEGSLSAAFALSTAGGIFMVQRLPPLGKLQATLIALAALIVWFFLHAAVSKSPVHFPRMIGSVALVMVAIGLGALGLQFLIRLRIIGILTTVIMATIFYWNEPNYSLVTSRPHSRWDDTEGRSNVSLQQSFLLWLASRNDLEEYRAASKPYPVFLITAEGGGGYASSHAYLFLSKIQRRCPNFAQHVFVLVGVSGGAVGNTLFRMSLPDNVNHNEFLGCMGDGRSDQDLDLLSTDHLSPLIGTLLFQDLPNRILFGFLGGPNRSEALMASLTDSVGVEPTSYWDHFWLPGEDGQFQLGEGPAVIDVATNVFSGRRYVIAPFSFSFPHGRFEEGVQDLNWEGPDEVGPRSADIGLMDAAVASASFPYVTPSLTFDGRLQERIALVDGGYIENSGAETLREILAELQNPNIWFDGATISALGMPESWVGNPKLDECGELTLQNIRVDPSGAFPEPDLEPDSCRIDFTLNVVTIRSAVPYRRAAVETSFFLDPISSLLNARWRRGETARYDLLSQICGMRNCPPQTELPDWRFLESIIVPEHLTLPLGWHMPRSAIERIDDYVAPLPGEELGIDNSPTGGMPEIIAWQSEVFWTMADNPIMVEYLQDTLNPQARN